MEYTDARNAIVRQRYELDGLGCATIAREIGLSRQRIFQLVKELGLRSPKPSKAERRARIPGLLKRGLTNREICEILGTCKSALWSEIRELPGHRELLRERMAARDCGKRRVKIPALVMQGMTGREIAEHFGVSASAIAKDMAALKLPQHLKDKRRENAMRANLEARARKPKRKGSDGPGD